MVFLGGPRQAGKTTFAQGLINKYKDGHPAYLYWDDLADRKKYKPIPKYYQVHQGTASFAVTDKILVLPFAEFCKIEKLF